MDKLTVKISIVITTKNRFHLLKRALKSVLRQTYTNIEVVVVDDCSDFNIASYLESLNKNIIFYRFNNSVGANACRNKGASLSTGDYIAYLDDDDEWLPNKLTHQLNTIINERAEFCYTAKNVLYSKDDKIYKKRYNYSKPRFDNLKISISTANFIGTTSSIFLSKKLFEDVGGFNERMPALQDYEFFIRIINKGYKVIGISIPLINYYEFSDKKNISGNFKRNILSSYYLMKINLFKRYSMILLLSVLKIFLVKNLKMILSFLK